MNGKPVSVTKTYTFKNITRDSTISAVFEKDEFIISVSINGKGKASSLSSDVGKDGIVVVKRGDSECISITPDKGYEIAAFYVDGVSKGGEGASFSSVTFSPVVANHTVSADIVQSEFTIKATVNGKGKAVGSPVALNKDGEAVLSKGRTETITFTADKGYVVDAFYVDGKRVKGTSYTFSSINADHTISADIVQSEFTIKATVNGKGKAVGSQAELNKNGEVVLSKGTTETITFTADSGYIINAIYVDGEKVDGTSYTFNSVDADHTISADIVQGRYKIRTEVNGKGKVTGFPSELASDGTVIVPGGDMETIRFTADKGYKVDAVYVDGEKVDGTVCTFMSVDADHTISADIVKSEFTIDTSVNGNGKASGTPVPLKEDGTVTVVEGDSETISFTPDTGYKVEAVYVDGIKIDGTSYKFSFVDADHTISADILQISEGTASSNTPGGSDIPGGDIDMDFPVVSEDYVVIKVSVDNGEFEVSQGEISGNYIIVEKGKDTVITFKGSEGFGMESLVVDGKTVDAALSYTFKTVSMNHIISVRFVQPKKEKVTVCFVGSGVIKELVVGEKYENLPFLPDGLQVFAGWQTKDGRRITEDSIVEKMDSELVPVWQDYTLVTKQKMNLTNFFADDLKYVADNPGTKYKYVVHTKIDAVGRYTYDKKGDNKLGSVVAKTGVFTAKKPGTVEVVMLIKEVGAKTYEPTGQNKLTISIIKPITYKQTLNHIGQTRKIDSLIFYTYMYELGNGSNYADIEYVSSNPSVLEVDSKTGQIKAIATGSAKLTAIFTTNSVVKVTVPILVKVPKFAEKRVKLKIGKTKKIKLINIAKDAKIEWTSDDNKIAVVEKNTGKITAKEHGITKISANVTNEDNTISTYSYFLIVE